MIASPKSTIDADEPIPGTDRLPIAVIRPRSIRTQPDSIGGLPTGTIQRARRV
jgi:hypothetical protein